MMEGIRESNVARTRRQDIGLVANDVDYGCLPSRIVLVETMIQGLTAADDWGLTLLNREGRPTL